MVKIYFVSIFVFFFQTFLNFTYDFWSTKNEEGQYEKRIRLVNITIPQRSWSAQFQGVREGKKYLHEVTMKKAVMKPTSDAMLNYVGWWTSETSDSFRIEEREIKLDAKHEIFEIEGEEIANRCSDVTSQDLEGFSKNTLVVSDVRLHYPIYGRIESLIFDGYFILSSKSLADSRFQKTFDLTSTYNNLKLTSHSVYRKEDMDSTTLYHNSHFTHVTSGTKAYNTIHFVSKSPPHKGEKTTTYEMRRNCKDIEFQHHIRSHVLDLSTDATYRCETDADNLHTLRLTLNTNSSKWNMLDIKLDQIIEDVSPTYSREEMTTNHATGTMHVDAEWNTEPKHSLKRVILCSKDGNCPNAELTIENWPGKRTIKFNRNDYEISYRRKFSSDYKTVNVNVGYGHKVDGDSDFLDFTGELIASGYHVWKGTLNRDTYNKVKDIFVAGYERFETAFAEIAKNEDHPLNEILRPALKMPLYDYWEGLKSEFWEFLSLSWNEVTEVLSTVDNFVSPVYEIFLSAAVQVREIAKEGYKSLADKSIIIWTVNYFHVPYYLQQGLSGLPKALRELWNQLALGEENVLHFKFVTGKIIAMTSLIQWPSLSIGLEDLTRIFSYKKDVRLSGELSEGDKVAMLFGPLHVYTFDGHLYDAPEYPHPDCTFLLAHDVYKSLFTVWSSQKGIHLLFPEMSISINEQNEVFVNGSRQQSSLPIQSSNGKVTVRSGNVLEVWTPTLSVICRSQDFLCILKLSDYHTGGVIGLLGNADEFSTNDFMLPNGNTSSLLEFARGYEISGKAECKNLVLAPTSPPASEEDKLACMKEFHHVVFPPYHIMEEFFETCAADVKAGHGTSCTATALSAFCSAKQLPNTQSVCYVRNMKSENIGRNLEVVLVVQESKFLTSADKSSPPAKGIESLIRAMDDRFKADGYESIKYGLVGFGGNGVHYKPNVHSSKNDSWLSADAMIKDVLKTLEFKSREGADSIRALKYALDELRHYSYGSKVFIVITAKDKQVADKALMDSVQNILEGNGITLYTLSSYPSIEKGKKVFGVRADGLIFPSQAKDGDAYMDYPRGNLAKLTSSTRGSVFLIKFFQDNKPSSFFAEFAQEVWAKVNKEAQKCRTCNNAVRRWWWCKDECNIVDC